jgi:hypothetical protein
MALQNQPKVWDENCMDEYIAQIIHPRILEIRK